MLKNRASYLLLIIILGGFVCFEKQRQLQANVEVNYFRQTDFPRVVELDPPNGATDVDPVREHITVTFDRPMGSGHSWVFEPPRPKLNRVEWVNDRQYRFYVELEAGVEYGIWLNRRSGDSEFQSREGVSAQEVHWTFKTRAPRASDSKLMAIKDNGRSVEIEPEAANVVKRFWTALEQSDWETALMLCSMEVKEGVNKYPSTEAFFLDVVPVREVLKKTRPSACSMNFEREPNYFAYIYNVRIPQKNLTRDAIWVWMVHRMEAKDGWEVCFSTTPFKTWLADEQEKIKLAEQEHLLKELTPRLKGVRTFLTPEQEVFKFGEPINFRLQLINDGNSVLSYDHQQVAVNNSMTITGPDGKQIEYIAGPIQTEGTFETIRPCETKTLFDRFDIAKQYDIKKPGKYHVQFNGSGLWVSVKTDDKAAEKESFKGYPGRFPSNSVEIEIKPN